VPSLCIGYTLTVDRWRWPSEIRGILGQSRSTLLPTAAIGETCRFSLTEFGTRKKALQMKAGQRNHGTRARALFATPASMVVWLCGLSYATVVSEKPGTPLGICELSSLREVCKNSELPINVGTASFALRPHLIRSVLARGGSSTDAAGNAGEDEEWLKVKSVADVRSAISLEEDITSSETNTSESGSTEENEVDAEVPNDIVYTEENLTFGASKPGDGSESDPDGIPTRFLKMQKGNREKAKKAFAHTLEWRAARNVDKILWETRPLYDLCKSIFPHYFSGRDVLNNPILVQRPGQLDLEKAHKYNITMDQLLMDFVYALEYCWNIMEPGPPDGVMTTVVDMRGVSLKTVRNGEMRDFILRSIHVISENYPQRSFRTLVINTPRWFGGIFKIVKPLLRESTKKKMEILMPGKNQDTVLRKYLGDNSVPRELLTAATDDESKSIAESAGDKTGPNSLIEQEIRAFAMYRLKQNGLEMYVESE